MAYKYNYFNKLSVVVASNGFTVTPTKGKRPVVRKWHNPTPTDSQWLTKMVEANRYADHNLGIVCGRVIGIDIDADDPDKVKALKALAIEHLGPTLFERVGRAPRTLLLYRPSEGESIPSMSRIGDCVDVLSGGKQFIAFGIHPDTGQPYQWLHNDPATNRLEDVPEITAAEVKSFTEAASKTVVGTPTIRPTEMSLTTHQRARRSDMRSTSDGIERDPSGRVVDGREKFMRNITAAEYAKDKNTTPDNLANRVWARFIAEADLTRPKGSNPKQRWSFKDAQAKARSTCRRRPDLRPPRHSRGGHPASRLNAWRKPDFWTQAEREQHLAEVGQRIKTPSVLAVEQVMIEAVDLATGFCTLPIAEIAKRASYSTRSVKKARSALTGSGFWIRHRGVCIPQALNSVQVIEKKENNEVRGNTNVPPLYHLSLVSSSSPSLSSNEGAIILRPYQADRFGGSVVDLNQYRQGVLPADIRETVIAEMRARGATQDELAAKLGISQPQLANALSGCCGLSPESAARLVEWLY